MVEGLTVAKIREAKRILQEADDAEGRRLDYAYKRWKLTGDCDHPRWILAFDVEMTRSCVMCVVCHELAPNDHI